MYSASFCLVKTMKKIVAFILIFLLALCPMYILTSSATGDYLVEDGVLLSFTGLTTTVTIPEDVYYIADGAFKDNIRINKLNLHSGVKIIGNEAFYGCTSLKEVNGGENVDYVGAYAFYNTPYYLNNNDSLFVLGSVVLGGRIKGEVVIDNNIKMIAPYAFSENTSITSFTSSDSLTVIGEGAFYRCTNLSNVDVSDGLSYVGPLAFYSTGIKGGSADGFVVLGDGILVEYQGIASSVTIPENIKQIAGGAFYSNTKITEVKISNGVVSIGERAFMNCSKLESVNLPESLLMLDKESFARCKSLLNVTIPKNVELMGESIFFGCNSLEKAQIKTVADIPKGMFANCSSLEYIKFPSKVASIGESAFLDCVSLTDISVSDNVAYIGSDAFKGAESLTVSCNEGSYAFDYCTQNGINGIQCGDANLDGKINIRDATYIQKHLASIIEMSEIEMIRAEANFDDKINVRDATYIQKLLAGLV